MSSSHAAKGAGAATPSAAGKRVVEERVTIYAYCLDRDLWNNTTLHRLSEPYTAGTRCRIPEFMFEHFVIPQVKTVQPSQFASKDIPLFLTEETALAVAKRTHPTAEIISILQLEVFSSEIQATGLKLTKDNLRNLRVYKFTTPIQNTQPAKPTQLFAYLEGDIEHFQITYADYQDVGHWNKSVESESESDSDTPDESVLEYIKEGTLTKLRANPSVTVAMLQYHKKDDKTELQLSPAPEAHHVYQVQHKVFGPEPFYYYENVRLAAAARAEKSKDKKALHFARSHKVYNLTTQAAGRNIVESIKFSKKYSLFGWANFTTDQPLRAFKSEEEAFTVAVKNILADQRCKYPSYRAISVLTIDIPPDQKLSDAFIRSTSLDKVKHAKVFYPSSRYLPSGEVIFEMDFKKPKKVFDEKALSLLAKVVIPHSVLNVYDAKEQQRLAQLPRDDVFFRSDRTVPPHLPLSGPVTTASNPAALIEKKSATGRLRHMQFTPPAGCGTAAVLAQNSAGAAATLTGQSPGTVAPTALVATAKPPAIPLFGEVNVPSGRAIPAAAGSDAITRRDQHASISPAIAAERIQATGLAERASRTTARPTGHDHKLFVQTTHHTDEVTRVQTMQTGTPHPRRPKHSTSFDAPDGAAPPKPSPFKLV